jgi:Tol biopolymer transport system component
MNGFLRSLLLLTALAVLAALAGCGSSGGNRQPPPPPAPTNIFAYLHRSGIPGDYTRYEIMVMQSDGTSTTVAPTAQYDSAVLGPDGQTVLFSFYNPPNYQIATINVDGTGQSVLTNGLYPKYTPDGSKIVYQSGQWLAVMNADGSDATITSVGQYCFPATNGSIIAGWMANGETEGLATVNMDGSNAQVILPTEYFVYPAVSADGSTVFLGMSTGSDENIYSIGSTGSNLLQLTASPVNWDPIVANNKIYFVAVPSSLQSWTIDSQQIFSINPDGSDLTQVTNDTLYDGFQTANGLCLNP